MKRVPFLGEGDGGQYVKKKTILEKLSIYPTPDLQIIRVVSTPTSSQSAHTNANSHSRKV